jgi:hypothetical protein
VSLWNEYDLAIRETVLIKHEPERGIATVTKSEDYACYGVPMQVIKTSRTEWGRRLAHEFCRLVGEGGYK